MAPENCEEVTFQFQERSIEMLDSGVPDKQRLDLFSWFNIFTVGADSLFYIEGG